MKIEVRKTNRKTVAISIVDGKVIARAPKYMSDAQILTFVETKRDWIEEKLKEYVPLGIDVDTMDYVRVYGSYLKLKIVDSPNFSVNYNDEELIVHADYKLKPEQLNKMIEDSFKKDLLDYLDQKVSDYAQKLQIKTPPFKVRRYKRLYGRCSNKHELAFNLYLFQESYNFIDYVVLHECAHILEFNHSSKFYNIIKQHMPDYKLVIAANKHAQLLHQDQ